MDEQPASTSQALFISLTADIVASYASSKKMAPSDLTGPINQVNAALSSSATGKSEPEPQNLEPAVPI